jgi:hypothetical protein
MPAAGGLPAASLCYGELDEKINPKNAAEAAPPELWQRSGLDK